MDFIRIEFLVQRLEPNSKFAKTDSISKPESKRIDWGNHAPVFNDGRILRLIERRRLSGEENPILAKEDERATRRRRRGTIDGSDRGCYGGGKPSR